MIFPILQIFVSLLDILCYWYSHPMIFSFCTWFSCNYSIIRINISCRLMDMWSNYPMLIGFRTKSFKMSIISRISIITTRMSKQLSFYILRNVIIYIPFKRSFSRLGEIPLFEKPCPWFGFGTVYLSSTRPATLPQSASTAFPAP